jgi:hypothetical protein
LRSGSIEVMHQGRRYRNHQDPQGRMPFTNAPAFRAASFAPRETIDLSTLISAVRQYEQLTGDDVDVEEGAISAAFKKLANEEMGRLFPVISEANTLQAGQDSSSDDAVRILAGEGSSFRETRDRVSKIREAIGPDNLVRIAGAHTTLREVWPALRDRPEGSSLKEEVQRLEELIGSETFYERLGEINGLAGRISEAYRTVYLARHQERFTAFSAEIEAIKGYPGWALLRKLQKEGNGEGTADAVLIPLSSRACEHPDLPEGNTTCRNCRATLSQMESDLAALSGLRTQVLSRIIELTTPEPRIERVQLASFFNGGLESSEEVKAAVNNLEKYLLKLVADEVQIICE